MNHQAIWAELSIEVYICSGTDV